MIDDLDGDDFDVVDIIVQIEEKLNISIPEEEIVVEELHEQPTEWQVSTVWYFIYTKSKIKIDITNIKKLLTLPNDF